MLARRKHTPTPAPVQGLGAWSVELVHETRFLRDGISILDIHARALASGRFDLLKGSHKVFRFVLVLDHAAVAHQ